MTKEKNNTQNKVANKDDAQKNSQNKNKTLIKVIVIVLVMVLLIGGGTLLYNYILKNTDTATNTPSKSQQNIIQAPDFTVYDKTGKTVNLSSFKGKPVIVNFWASWCTPCKYEMPFFDKAYSQYSEQIEFMMINLSGGGNDKRENADKFIAEGGYKFPVYYDTDMDGAITYGITAMPVTFFIDKDGNIVSGYKGAITHETLSKEIENLLAKK